MHIRKWSIFIVIFLIATTVSASEPRMTTAIFPKNTGKSSGRFFPQRIVSTDWVGVNQTPSSAISDLKLDSTPGNEFNSTRLDNDINRIFTTGYFKAVSATIIPTKNGVHIQFCVDENPIVSNIIISGTSPERIEQLMPWISIPKNRILNLVQLATDINTLETQTHESGRTFFSVESAHLTPDNSVEIAVNEGEISTINLKGLHKIPPSILFRNLKLHPGVAYQQQLADSDRQWLVETGYFSEVGMVDAQVTSDNMVAITIPLRERLTNYIDMGIETDGSVLRGFSQLTMRHIWIPSDSLALKLGATLINSDFGLTSYSLQYQQPWILNTVPNPLIISIWSGIQPNTLTDVRRTGGSIGIKTVLFDGKLDVTHFTKVETVKVGGDYESTYTMRAIGQNWRIQYGNPLSLRPSGGYWSTDWECGGNAFGIDVGGLAYTKIDTTLATFIPLSPAFTFANRIQFGVIRLQDAGTYETEALYLGGAKSLRGYGENQFVGTHRLIVNSELHWALSDTIDTVLFLDTGYTINADTAGEIAQWRWGYGPGLRWVTPIGVFGIDLGFSPGQTVIHAVLGSTF